MLRLGALLISPFLLMVHAQAQTLVSDDEAIAHLSSYVAPVRPAGVPGSHDIVAVKLHIAKDGSVTSAIATQGILSLRSAAIAAVKQWHYRPFDEGAVVATISVEFEKTVAPAWLKQDEAVSVRFFSAEDLCRKALRTLDADMALKLCSNALTIAKEFPDEANRHLEILGAYELYGRALLQRQEPEKAEPEFNVAVSIASKYLKPLNAEYAYPLMWRAVALQNQGKISAALRDYEESERSMRLAIANIEGLKKEYATTLRTVLRRHASLLRTQHEVAKAEQLEKEAENLATQFPSSE